MKYLASIIREARRPASAFAGTGRRSGPEAADEAGPAQAAIRSQPDQGDRNDRFQKEGAARSREVPEGGQRTRSDSVASPASPFTPGGGQPPSVRWQPEEENSVDGNVDEVYVSRQSDLATGKAYDTAERSTFASAGNGSGEVPRVQTSNESTTHGTEAQSQPESTTQQSGATFEHGVEQRIRQAPGAGTPSDLIPTPVDPAALTPGPAHNKPAPASSAPAPQFAPAQTESTGTGSTTPAAAPAPPVAPAGQRLRGSAARGEPGAEPPGEEPRPAVIHPAPAPAHGAGDAESRPQVVIGQVDVTVVSAGRAPADRTSPRGSGFLSRNYLRRL